MATVLSGGILMPMTDGARTAPLDLRIDKGVIVAMGPQGTLTLPGDEVIDCGRKLITPGFINVHTHAATGLFRGRIEDAAAEVWGNSYVVPGQEKLTPADYAQSAQLSCAEFLLNGVTCIADRWDGMTAIAPAIEATGIRAVVGQSLSDRNVTHKWRDTAMLVERYGVNPRSRISVGIAPHALDTCSDELLSECGRRASSMGCRLFVHVAQSRGEVESLRRRGFEGALQCMEKTGLVGPHVVAAHCIFLDEREIRRWPSRQISIAHCPASNIKIEGRTIPIVRFLGQVAIGLGTDWAISNNTMDLLAEARLATLVGKLLAADPEVCAVSQILETLTLGAAKVLGIESAVGSLEVGKQADLIVFDLERLEAAPHHDLAANLLHSMTTRCIRDVYVEGECLVRNGLLVRASEADLAAELVGLGNKMGLQ